MTTLMPALTEAELAILSEALLDGIVRCPRPDAQGGPDAREMPRRAIAQALEGRGLLLAYAINLGATDSAAWMLTPDSAVWANTILNERGLTPAEFLEQFGDRWR